MGRNILCFPSPLNNEELGQNSDTLKPNTERPEDLLSPTVLVSNTARISLGWNSGYLWKRVLVVEYHSRSKGSNDKKFNLESIDIGIKGRPERHLHQVQNVNRTHDEEDLHNRVVQRYIRPKQIFPRKISKLHCAPTKIEDVMGRLYRDNARERLRCIGIGIWSLSLPRTVVLAWCRWGWEWRRDG